MEEEMKEAQQEIDRRKAEAEMKREREQKKLKVATPGREPEFKVPKTPSVRSKFGL